MPDKGFIQKLDSNEWLVGQSNVYAYKKVNELFLFTVFVYEGWVGSQKITKLFLLFWMTPKVIGN